MSCQPAAGHPDVVLFFVDLGQRSCKHVPLDELRPLPAALLHFAAFQAIWCQLAGVRPAFGADTW